jgi:hypothetical protein
MTKAKLAILFTLLILIALGYCGLAGGNATWGLWALAVFLLSSVGLLVVGFFALFDWMYSRSKE